MWKSVQNVIPFIPASRKLLKPVVQLINSTADMAFSQISDIAGQLAGLINGHSDRIDSAAVTICVFM